MTLSDKIKLIDDLIKENPDTAIIEYLAAVQEIENIEKGIAMQEKFDHETTREYILRLAAEMTPRQIRTHANIPFSTIYKALKAEKFDLKEQREIRKAQQAQDRVKARSARQMSYQPDKPKEKIVRPPTVYSNSSPWGIASQFINQKTA